MERTHDLILFGMAGGLVFVFAYFGLTDVAADMGKVLVGAIVMYLKGK